MKDIDVSNVRNIVILGHTGSGKTVLTDALTFKLGLNDRLGSVDSETSIADYSDQEKSRRITLFSKPFTGSHTVDGKKMGLVFTDTPGYMDFFGQVVAARSSADTGLISVDAAAGVQVGTRHVWKCCEKAGLARAIVVTGLDKENTSFASTLAEIQSTFGNKCVPVMLPTADATGIVDVIASKEIPDDMASDVEETKGSLVELAAETDDSLIEKFLGGGDLSPAELSTGLRDAVHCGGFIPVFACMPLKDTGITELLDGICRLLPSPLDKESADKDGAPIPASPDAPMVAFVWRTVNDPFVGQLTFVRVLGGTLKADSEAQNTSRNEKERVSSLLVVCGKKQAPVPEATAGDIVAIPKLKSTSVGDTLCAPGGTTVCSPIVFPNPVMFQSVSASTQADEDKIGIALSRVVEEDPTLKIERNRETKQILLGGLGDVHIEVAVDLMKSRSNVDVLLSTPKVPYRETVTGEGQGHYKHKKQSGGRGQYGEVYLRVGPKQPDDEDGFVNAIVGGVIPNNFIPAVQKGLVEGMTAGAVAGYPVTDIKVTLYDGSYHDVDSSEIAFKIAGARALKEAMGDAKPVLLEPIMTVKVAIPDQYLGDINGDLNHKRGRILGMGSEDGMQVITADVPQSELFHYAAELRSITAGQGSFEMEYSRYEIVPATITQKVVEATAQEKDEG